MCSPITLFSSLHPALNYFLPAPCSPPSSLHCPAAQNFSHGAARGSWAAAPHCMHFAHCTLPTAHFTLLTAYCIEPLHCTPGPADSDWSPAAPRATASPGAGGRRGHRPAELQEYRTEPFGERGHRPAELQNYKTEPFGGRGHRPAKLSRASTSFRYRRASFLLIPLVFMTHSIKNRPNKTVVVPWDGVGWYSGSVH